MNLRTDFKNACITGNLKLVNSLIALDLVRIPYMSSGKTRLCYPDGLYYACKYGQLQIIERLLELGINKFSTGLAGACFGGQLEIVNKMIMLGAKNVGWGFSLACYSGQLRVIERLLELGFSDFDKGLSGACMGRQLQIAKKMIKLGASLKNLARHRRKWYNTRLKIEEIFIEYLGSDIASLIII